MMPRIGGLAAMLSLLVLLMLLVEPSPASTPFKATSVAAGAEALKGVPPKASSVGRKGGVPRNVSLGFPVKQMQPANLPGAALRPVVVYRPVYVPRLTTLDRLLRGAISQTVDLIVIGRQLGLRTWNLEWQLVNLVELLMLEDYLLAHRWYYQPRVYFSSNRGFRSGMSNVLTAGVGPGGSVKGQPKPASPQAPAVAKGNPRAPIEHPATVVARPLPKGSMKAATTPRPVTASAPRPATVKPAQPKSGNLLTMVGIRHHSPGRGVGSLLGGSRGHVGAAHVGSVGRTGRR